MGSWQPWVLVRSRFLAHTFAVAAMAVTASFSLALVSSARAVDEVPGLCESRFVIVSTQTSLDLVLEALLADASDDGVFVLDAEAGAVIFGDGERGRVPATGPRTPIQDSPALRHRDRTVSVKDFAPITTGSPGARVARITIDVCPE